MTQGWARSVRRPVTPRSAWTALAGLGLVTIVAYGACYYAFAVFLGPISAATGWPEGTLGLTFGGVLVLNGALAPLGGRLLDRAGPRTALLLAGTIGAGLMALASTQSTLATFAASYIAGCGLVGAMAYYHVTQPAVSRATPHQGDQAILRLTILGVFASPIYLPLTQALIHATGWRNALRIEAGTVSAACLAAAIVVTNRTTPATTAALGTARQALRTAWNHPPVRRWVLAALIGGAATDLMLTYQVAITVAAGLTATAAASAAGLRGLSQLAGRIPLGVALRSYGARRTLVAAHVGAIASSGLLLASGDLWVAIAFSVLAGGSLGAITSLQGIYTKQLIDPHQFGTVFGGLQAVIGIGGAAGPALGGLILDLGGPHRLLVLPMTIGLLAALARLTRRQHDDTTQVALEAAAAPRSD